MTALTNASTLSRIEPERPAKRAGDGTADSSAVDAFCRGAGIDPSALPADTQAALLTLAGQMVREMILGMMEALKGRSDMKNRLRLSQTTIQPGENNPLKFSASVDEAVLKLLDPHGSRYLGPIEAIRESFADLRTHQGALVNAVQAATDELMSRIEPGELQERFDRGLKRGAILGAANKMKYWDLYVEFYQVLNQRNEQGLPALFAEEFARTYAERLTPKKK
jgi:type VI secretion system protein